MAEKYKSSSFCPDHGEGGVSHPHLIWTRKQCPGCHSQPLIILWQILAWNQVSCAKSLALCTSPPACQSWCFLNFGRALHLPAAESARCVLSGGGLHPIDPLSAQRGPWGHTPCIHTALIPAAIMLWPDAVGILHVAVGDLRTLGVMRLGQCSWL